MAVLDWARAMAFPADNGTFALLATITAQDPLRRTLCTERRLRPLPRRRPRHRSLDPRRAAHLQAARHDPPGKPLPPPRRPRRPHRGRPGPARRLRPPHQPDRRPGRVPRLRPGPAPRHHPRPRPPTRSPIPPPSTRGPTPISAYGTSPKPQADASLARRMQAAVDGKPSPPPEPMERLRLAIFSASRTDAPVALALRRMIHLVSLPEDVIGNEAVRTAARRPARRPPRTDRPSGRAQPRRDRRLRLAMRAATMAAGNRPGTQHAGTTGAGEHDRLHAHITPLSVRQ